MSLAIMILTMTIGPALPLAGQAPSTKPEEPASFIDRRQEAERLMAESGAEVAVAYRTLDGAEEWMFNPDRIFHAASTMKVAVMVELFRRAEIGDLRLSDPILVKNEFKSIVDGSTYSMSLADDSDDTVYQSIGKEMTLEALNFQMITVSSNLATNLLIDHLGVENVRNTVAALGAYGMEVRRGVEDQKAFDLGISNQTTARGLFLILNAIARGQAVSKEASARMIAVLSQQQFNDGIPRGLPPGTKVAHKTGTITRLHHDAAIILGDRPSVLVVLTRGLEAEAESDALIARITRALIP